MNIVLYSNNSFRRMFLFNWLKLLIIFLISRIQKILQMLLLISTSMLMKVMLNWLINIENSILWFIIVVVIFSISHILEYLRGHYNSLLNDSINSTLDDIEDYFYMEASETDDYKDGIDLYWCFLITIETEPIQDFTDPPMINYKEHFIFVKELGKGIDNFQLLIIL